jgi:hypothetical protein
MTSFNFYVPPSATDIMQALNDLINFKLLNPEFIIRIWDKDFTMEQFLNDTKGKLILDEKEMASMLGNITTYLFILGVFILGVLLVYAIYRLCSYFELQIKEKLIEMLIDVKDKFLFNGVLRSITISYLTIGINASIQLNMLVTDNKNLKSTNIVISFLMVLYLVVLIAVMTYLLHKNREDLDKEE